MYLLVVCVIVLNVVEVQLKNVRFLPKTLTCLLVVPSRVEKQLLTTLKFSINKSFTRNFQSYNVLLSSQHLPNGAIVTFSPSFRNTLRKKRNHLLKKKKANSIVKTTQETRNMTEAYQCVSATRAPFSLIS